MPPKSQYSRVDLGAVKWMKQKNRWILQVLISGTESTDQTVTAAVFEEIAFFEYLNIWNKLQWLSLF